MKKRRPNVCGTELNPQQTRAHTITHDYCVGCGMPGYDQCPACHEKEKQHIADNCGADASGDGITPAEWEGKRRMRLARLYAKEHK